MGKKIDIFIFKNGFWAYDCSTNRSKTCKEAKARYIHARWNYLDNAKVKAKFSK